MLLGGVASAYTDYSNTWFNIDSFDENSAAVKQQKNALWNTPQARLARMEVMMTQFREMEKLVAFWTEHGMDGKPVEADVAREKAYVVVRNNARRQADAALKAKPVQQLLEAADDLDEAAWLQSMTPELTRGLVCALEEQFDCFDWRGDGRDARRAELLSKALEQAGWLRSKGMDDKKYAAAQTSALLHRAAAHMASGMSGGAAFRQATADVHGASSISSPATSSGVAAWSGPGTPMEPQTMGLLYNKKTLAAAKKMLEAMLAHQSLTLNSQNSGVAGLSYSGNTSGGGAVGGGTGGSGGSAGAPPVAVSPAELWFRLLGADAPATIEVADGTTQSVMSPTTVGSISLGAGSTLYVADTLTLTQGGTLSVAENGTLLVKDGGKVILDKFTDGNEADAKLFDAFVKAAQTEGSGYIQINNASVQFGSGYYHLDIGSDNVNAVFDAHFKVLNNLTLQNWWRGNKGLESLWVVGDGGELHIDNDLTVDSYQKLIVKNGELVVGGTAHLGHAGNANWASTLDIQSGSVVLGQITGDTAGASTVSMSGGSLQVTHEGNAFINGIGEVNLSGGKLVANGNNWTLNHTSSIGNIGVETDATHTITLGTSTTTTTLTGDVTVNAGSNTVLNGNYAGTGSFVLQDGASLTLGQNFGTAAGSSVGLAGTGSVQVNWVGTPGALHDGFAESYDITYSPAGLAGHLNLNNAADLVWQDAAGNTLHNVFYEDGVLTGHIAADPTVYHIVTAGHQAVFDTDGNAAKAESFLLYNDGKLFIGKDRSVAVNQVTQNGHTLTLQGSGDYVLNGYSMPAKIQFDAEGADRWTGAVVISGSVSASTKVQSFDAFYHKGSTVALNGFDGISGEWNNGTLNANIRMDAQTGGTPAWRWNSGSTRTGTLITFAGGWSGAGDFVLGAKGGSNWLQSFTYTGDISDWTGRFLVESGSSTVTFAGDDKEVNAVFDKGSGTLLVNVATNTVFNADVTASEFSVDKGKTVEVGRDAVVDITSKAYDGNAFAAFADAMSGAGEVHMKGNTFSPAAGEHDIKTNFVFNSEVRLGNNATTWHVKADAPTEETPTPSVDGSLTVQNGDFFLLQQQTLSIEGGSVDVEKGSIWLGTSGIGSGIEMSSGSLSTQGILVNSAGNGTYASHVTMTGGTLNITGDTFLDTRGLISAAPVSLTGGTLLAENHAWTLNTNSTIGAVTVVTQGESGGITFGKQGVTTTLTDIVDNRGTLTLDGTVNLTMETSNTAYGFVDAAGHVNYSGVGFDATITMPGEVYNVVSGNAAAMGSNLTWTANGQTLTVVDESQKESAPANALYFDGFNLRPVRDLDNPETQRTGTIYHMGARGDYTMSAADAAIATGIELTGRGGSLHVGTTPTNTVSLDLAAGQLVLENGADLTVGEGQNWSMEAGASIVLGAGSVLTLPGVWGETTPNSYTNSYSAYHLLHNTSGEGKVLFEGDVSWQFGNAGHNIVSTGSYNILDEYGAENGVNADITFDLEVNGNMLIQNYRQGKDHPEVGSWWKVSDGGSLTVHGNFESSSYQKVSVEGGNVVVDGTYKIGHEAGREYEGDLELKSGSLTVGTLQTVHEDTSTVHISGGKLTVTQGNAFANHFREVSARDAEFEGTWTWNHDAVIGNITVTEGSAITLGTADTTLTLESPIKANNGALTLDGTIKADVEKQEGAWSYGTEETGYTPDGDGYYKRTDDLYTLVLAGNNAELGENVKFILNGQTLSADDFNWDGKAIGMGGTEAGTVYFLNTANGYTYTDADTRTTAFELVNTGATLRLERDPAALETIHALGGTVSLGSGVCMESDLLDAEDTVTMAGEGTYLLSNNALMAHPAAHHVSFADAAWTGTVQMSGMLGTEGSLNDLGNSGSWVEMQGVFGADAAPSMAVNVKLTDKAGQTAWIYTGDGHDVAVTGDWAGSGTFQFAPVGGASQQLTYSGDLSAWDGTFSAQGGTAQLHFAGDAHVVNAAMQQQGGRIELTADTDTHFTNTTAAASYEAAGGNLVADKADAEAVDTIRATGGDVSLKGLAEATSVSLKELTIADNHSVSASTVNGEMQNAAIEVSGEGSTLTAGVESKLNADLTLGSGATVSIDDRDKGLQVNGSLTLSKGSGITLSPDMMNSLLDKGTLVLFSGVTEFTYGNVTTTGPVTAYNGVEAQDYFKNLVDIICEQTGRPYFITYSGSGNGGIVAIVPEPATTTLSLLALTALMARRKRR